MLYSPIAFNRRFALGSSLPMGLLAGLAFWQIWLKTFKRAWLKDVVIIILALGLIMGNSCMIMLDFFSTNFFNYNQWQALTWVKNNLPKDSRIFANALIWDTIISGVTARPSFVSGGF